MCASVLPLHLFLSCMPAAFLFAWESHSVRLYFPLLFRISLTFLLSSPFFPHVTFPGNLQSSTRSLLSLLLHINGSFNCCPVLYPSSMCRDECLVCISTNFGGCVCKVQQLNTPAYIRVSPGMLFCFWMVPFHLQSNSSAPGWQLPKWNLHMMVCILGEKVRGKFWNKNLWVLDVGRGRLVIQLSSLCMAASLGVQCRHRSQRHELMWLAIFSPYTDFLEECKRGKIDRSVWVRTSSVNKAKGIY